MARERTSVLQVVLRDWTRRIGPEAAAHRVAGYRLLFHAWIASLIGMLLLVIGGLNRSPIVVAVGGVAVLSWVVLSIQGFLELSRMNTSIAAALSIGQLSFFSGPPSRSEKYEAWCKKQVLNRTDSTRLIQRRCEFDGSDHGIRFAPLVRPLQVR